MANAVSIRLEGFESLEKRLKAMPARIERACYRKALRSTATKISRRLKAITKQGLTGDAKRAVRVKVRVRHGGAWASVDYKAKPAFYMRLYETGSKRQAARPFFASAIAGYEREVSAEFTEALKLAVERTEAIPA